MRILLRILDTDTISYQCFGFWGCVRRRLRDFVPYSIQRFWGSHIRTIYAPQHSNLRDSIPKTWCDLDGCIETFLFACVIDFVENEDGLDDWEGQSEMMGFPLPHDCVNPRHQQAAMLREVYNWAKTGRQAAETAMFAAGSKNGYSEWRCIEDEATAKTERYLEWIIEWRGMMWT